MTETVAQRLVDGYDLVIFDLDGVVYEGTIPIPGAVEAINKLHAEGSRITYATNNASRQPGEVAALLTSLGLTVTGDDVSTSHDDILDGWNTQSSSQWDGFRHIRHHALREDGPGTGHFGGVDDADHGIDHWAGRGIVGRGVLADIGRWRDARGRPIAYDEPDPVMPDELLACLADQGTEVGEGALHGAAGQAGFDAEAAEAGSGAGAVVVGVVGES